MKNSEYSKYKESGYFLYKGFFSREEIDVIREDAKKIFISQFLEKGFVDSPEITESQFESAIVQLFNNDFPTFVNCGKQAQHLVSLHRISLHEKLIAKLKEFGMRFPAVSTRPVLYFNKSTLAKAEEFYKVPPHQDWRSMQGSLNSMVVWLPLVDVNEELGALKVIPGSHLAGLMDSTENIWYRQINDIDPGKLISVEVEIGDALFFSAFLIHSSGNNILDRIRWSCHFRYNDLEEKTFIQRGYPHPYIYKPTQDLITNNFPTPAQIEAVFR
jgi:hypothetical protein